MASDEQQAFYYAVFLAVMKVPRGRVTSYGHIAYLIGKPRNSRQVGQTLKHLNVIRRTLRDGVDDETLEEIERFEQLPWWRIVLSSGRISPRERSNGQIEQARKLREEDIEVLMMYSIDLEIFGWFPEDIE